VSEKNSQTDGSILIPVSAAELLDKLTILELKLERIPDPKKLKNVEREYALLSSAFSAAVAQDGKLSSLRARLKEVNAAIWDVEEALRAFERKQSFGRDFIEQARGAYLNNDVRSAVKRRINELLSSSLVEEKSHGE